MQDIAQGLRCAGENTKRYAGDELHHDGGHIVCFNHLMNHDDVGVIEGGCRPGFAHGKSRTAAL